MDGRTDKQAYRSVSVNKRWVEVEFFRVVHISVLTLYSFVSQVVQTSTNPNLFPYIDRRNRTGFSHLCNYLNNVWEILKNSHHFNRC